MGSCVSCRTRSHASYRFQSARTHRDTELLAIAGPSRGKQIAKFLVQIVQLRWDPATVGGEDLYWDALCDALVTVTVTCVEEGSVYYEYELSSDNQYLFPFSTYITIPGTELRCTKPHFVEWRDMYSGDVYGLNFTLETDVTEFLSVCSPPTLTPTSARKRATALPSYLSATPPSPIACYVPTLDDTLSNSFPPQSPSASVVLDPPAEFSTLQEQLQSKQSDDLPNSFSQQSEGGVVVCDQWSPESVIGGGTTVSVTSGKEGVAPANESDDDVEMTMIDDEEEEDSPELFRPTSALEFNRNLPDIMEEEEDIDDDRGLNEQEESSDVLESCKLSNDLMVARSPSPVEPGVVVDTNRGNPLSSNLSVKEFDQFLRDLRLSQLLEITEEHSWRISRQPESFEKLSPIVESDCPGNEFSPRMSVLLSDEECGRGSVVEMSQELVTALQAISMDTMEDSPPEFPSSPPPGKLLSPRQSFQLGGRAGRSLKRSLSHKERDFLQSLGSCLGEMDEGEKEGDKPQGSAHSQTRPAIMPSSKTDQGLLGEGELAEVEDLTKIPSSVENQAKEIERKFSNQEAIERLIQESMTMNGLTLDPGMTKEREELSPALPPWQSVLHCARELVETEQSHIENLDHLVYGYLRPLQNEPFLPDPEEVERVYINLSSTLSQQTLFLRRLEECVEGVSDGESEGVKRMMLRVADVFQSNVEMFRSYSFFCTAQHMWANITEANLDSLQLEQFLQARNPAKDPKLSVESLIIKAILRVLRYPLFLQTMRKLTRPDSEEHMQLSEVILMVEEVSGFINEVKRVTEIYAGVFDSLLQESGLAEFGVSVHISDLHCNCKCMWLNPAAGHRDLARGWKKGEGPTMQCFAFPSAAVLICTDRDDRKRGSKGTIQGHLDAEDVSYSVLLPLAQCKVNDLPDSDGVDNMWQIVHKSTRRGSGPQSKYLLRSRSAEEKGRMIHILRQSIQDQVSLYVGIRTSVSLSLTHAATFSGSSMYSSGHSRSPSIASQMTLLSRTDSQNLSGSEATTSF